MRAGSVLPSREVVVALATGVAIAFVLLLAPVRALAAGRPSATPKRGAPRAPSGPVLSPGGVLGGEASASAPSSGGDPLAGNGLDSPLCRNPGGLSAAQRRSCETDSFVAAADPTNDYAFDVNIDTGVGKWGNDMSATIDDFAQYGWMALVSATHGLVVMFEWCYALNLLSGALLSQVTGALRNARLTFTEPWLEIVLALASILVVYHGLVRRQVAETMGQALAMLAMMAGGLWVMADPAGTVGAVEQWTNQAGLGTMAAVASGSPEHAERTLADNMQVVFGSVVTTPWCYLEFGDVGWCDGADRLDGALRNAGLTIAKSEEAKSGCRGSCAAGAGPGSRTLFASAALLREAQTNGELFLALPANESGRNSATKAGTLLNVLCGGGKSAAECRGPTSSQAEFRSQKGTGSRVIGLLAIWLGALGMLLLLGYLALRLLGAALVGLFFLLLAPAAVLAPALGDGGRSAFRGWALKLLEAVIAKLTYSFLLGVVLMMMRLLLSLTILGWWEQWLLVSAFWWSIFLKRHQTLGWVTGAGRDQAQPRHRSMARRVEGALETPRALLKPLAAIRKHRQPAPEVKPSSASRSNPRTTISPRTDGDSPGKQAGAQAALAGSSAAADPMAHGKRLERLRRERQKALADGDTRRALELGAREQRIEGKRARRGTLAIAMLDPELELGEVASMASAARRPGGERTRSGSAVAGRAGVDPHAVGHAQAARPPGAAAGPGLVRKGGLAAQPGLRGASRAVDALQGGGSPRQRDGARQESTVMDDAREVAARRKRQLGWGPERPGPGRTA